VSEPSSLLQRERTVLVVVDLQAKLLPAINENDRVLGNNLLLLRLARVLRLPVVLTTQYRKGLGPLVDAVLAEAPGLTPLDKVSFGCFGDDTFLSRLAAFEKRDQLLVSGIESHICVMQTVLGALDRGYTVHLAGDAVGSRTEANRQVGLSRMQRAGAFLSSAEMAAYELLTRSDAEAFKTMLPFFKGGPQAAHEA
jgi:nicotinamidase-related amidase